MGGRTHLVQTGDVVDRGPESRKTMELLMRLESEARRAGGHVHVLIGNHEAMNMYGDLRYTTPEEYQAFRDRNSEKLRQRYLEHHLEELKKSLPPEDTPEFDQAYEKQWESQHPLGYVEHRLAFIPQGRYGKWILGHNAIVKINDTLFLHGGISPQYANESILAINEMVRAELEDFTKLPDGIVLDQDGPLWYRGLAKADEDLLIPHVEQILENHGVRRIVVGHTITEGAVMPRVHGKILLIDVGLSDFFGARQACLILEGDRTYALHRGRKLPIPMDSGSGLLEYLKHAADLDPAPLPLQSLIHQLEARPLVPTVP